MTLRSVRFWHCVLAGAVCACAAVWLHAQHDWSPRNSERTSQESFTAEFIDRPGNRKPPRVSNITFYPPSQEFCLVTYHITTPTAEGRRVLDRYFFTRPSQVQPPGEELRRWLGQARIPIRRAWWADPMWGWLGYGGAVFITISVGLPLALRAMYGPSPNPDPPASPLHPTPHSPRHPSDANASPVGSRPVDSLPDPAAPRSVRGKWYPVFTSRSSNAFTIIELLAVIAIIAVLVSITMPALIRARGAAQSIVCTSNLRNIGAGFQLYLNDNRDMFPAAYMYIGHAIDSEGRQTPVLPTMGYRHWSFWLYDSGGVDLAAFRCPSMPRGGLPPTNTTPDNLDPGQFSASPGIIDQQAPRLAYTVNEAICPRNKFSPAFQEGERTYRYVRSTEIANSTGTILGAEFITNAAIIGSPMDEGHAVMSHRPVHGFVGNDGQLNMHRLGIRAGYRPVQPAEIDPDPLTMNSADSLTRLDWVGRNHGSSSVYPNRRTGNFLYLDSHIEAKSVYNTLGPQREWGDKMWSLTPNDDIQP